jgi:hypothetical protein
MKTLSGTYPTTITINGAIPTFGTKDIKKLTIFILKLKEKFKSLDIPLPITVH